MPTTDAVERASDEVAGAPPGASGDRNRPVPLGDVADIGGGWRMQVRAVTPNGAAAVAAENQFNEAPPAGSDFTLVEVAMGYFGLEDPRHCSNRRSLPSELPVSNSRQSAASYRTRSTRQPTCSPGGGLRQHLLRHYRRRRRRAAALCQRRVVPGDDVFLASTGAGSGAPALSGLPGIQDGAAASDARRNPAPIGTNVDIGEGWNATVTAPARDITDAVAAENPSNGPLPRAPGSSPSMSPFPTPAKVRTAASVHEPGRQHRKRFTESQLRVFPTPSTSHRRVHRRRHPRRDPLCRARRADHRTRPRPRRRVQRRTDHVRITAVSAAPRRHGVIARKR